MQVISIAEMKRLEQRAVSLGVSEFELMKRAGRGAARLIAEYAGENHCRRLVFLIGRGNNAGDALIAAEELASDFPVKLYGVSPFGEFRGAAAEAAAELKCAPTPEILATLDDFSFLPGDLIVDGLLGTGFSGKLREQYENFIRMANRSRLPIIALDIPSGIPGDTGELDSGIAIRATMTISFGYPKKGLFLADGPEYTGMLRLVPIGLETPLAGESNFFFAADAAMLLPHRQFHDYKQRSGRVAIFAGSAKYSGAAVLNARGAMGAGAGMVTLFTPARPAAAVPASLIFRQLPADGSGAFTAEAAEWIFREGDSHDAFAAGSGWGEFPAAERMLERLLVIAHPVVLDADALHCAARHPQVWKRKHNCVVTPHVGEARALADAFGVARTPDRVEFASMLAQKLGCVVLLKGPYSVAASPDGGCRIVCSGNSNLATAGSGDVLTGVIAALMARGMAALEAAAVGAFLHGRAGEHLLEGMSADDLPEQIIRVCDVLYRGNCR